MFLFLFFCRNDARGVAWVVAGSPKQKERKGTDRVDRPNDRTSREFRLASTRQPERTKRATTREGRSATIITPLPCDNHLFFNSFWLGLAHSASPSPVMGYSQDQPSVPSQDHSSFSTNGLRIPFSPMSHGSPHQSPRRLSPAIDEPSSLPSPSLLSGSERPPLPTRASTLGSESELDPKSHSDPSLPKYSRSEDLNHSSIFAAPSPSFLTTSRPNTPGSSSRDRNQPSPSEHLGRRLSGASGSSHSTSSGLAESRPPTSVTSASSGTLVS